MERQDLLSEFFNAIGNDPRIGVSHISLYCALLQKSNEPGCEAMLYFLKADIMKIAKISALGTFHKCIRDLHNYGYIKYQPSYNYRKKSKVSLLINRA
jgi:hypothetical protein